MLNSETWAGKRKKKKKIQCIIYFILFLFSRSQLPFILKFERGARDVRRRVQRGQLLKNFFY
jgi:hypothetical protein